MKRVKKINAYSLTVTAIFTALIAIGAFIKIPTFLVPVTLQTFFVTLAALLLGGRRAFSATSLYILLGLVGLPVFTMGGGPSYVLQPSFGYLIGFAVMALVTGHISQRDTAKTSPFMRMATGSLIGLAIVYFFGVLHLFLIQNFYLGVSFSLWKGLSSGMLLFLPFDVLTSLLACVLATRLKPHINQNLFKTPYYTKK